MLWTVAQVAEFLQCSTCWVYRHKHELPLVRVGGILRFDSVRLQGMVSSQRAVAALTRTVDVLYWHKKWGPQLGVPVGNRWNHETRILPHNNSCAAVPPVMRGVFRRKIRASFEAIRSASGR
jgi:hypothetical protein